MNKDAMCQILSNSFVCLNGCMVETTLTSTKLVVLFGIRLSVKRWLEKGQP